MRSKGYSTSPTISPARRYTIPVGGFDFARSVNLSTIASATHIPLEELKKLIISDSAYKYRLQPKKSGGNREIARITPHLKHAQRGLYQRILKKVTLPDFVQSVAGKSYVQHAKIHTMRPALITADINSFFPTIRPELVRRALSFFGFNQLVAAIITKLTTHKNMLPQGAPTSTAISNLVAFSLDRRLWGLAETAGATYSRYVDDIAISGPTGIKRLMPSIIRIVQEEGFKLNSEKGGLIFSPSSELQVVTKIVVNQRLSASKAQRAIIEKQVHIAAKFGWKKVFPGLSIKRARKKMHGLVHYLRYLDVQSKRRNGISFRLLKKMEQIVWD